MATSNPAFSRDMFPGYEQVYGVPRSTTMTVQGTVGKTFVLLAILLATAAWSWNAVAGGHAGDGRARRCRHRRLHRGDDHDLQADRRPVDRADLRGARRGLPGGDLAGRRAAIRPTVSRPAASSMQAVRLTVRRAVRDDVRLRDAPDPRHREAADGHRDGDRRHCACSTSSRCC